MHAYKTLTKCEYPENIQNVCSVTKYLQNIWPRHVITCKVVACFFMKYENASLILQQQQQISNINLNFSASDK